jgi:hypothetical protein
MMSFLRQYCVLGDEKASTPGSVLYKLFCDKVKYMDRARFYKQLHQIACRKFHGGNSSVYFGIKLKEAPEPTQTEAKASFVKERLDVINQEIELIKRTQELEDQKHQQQIKRLKQAKELADLIGSS